MSLDGAADVGQRSFRLHCLDSEHQALVGHSHEPLRAFVDVADEERGVRVAMDALAVERDVEVHDVAVLQRSIVGDAVADDLVHRGAERLAVAVVVERARVAVALDAGGVADRVELVGGDAGSHGGTGEREDLRGGSAGPAHALDHIR